MEAKFSFFTNFLSIGGVSSSKASAVSGSSERLKAELREGVRHRTNRYLSVERSMCDKSFELAGGSVAQADRAPACGLRMWISAISKSLYAMGKAVVIDGA
jgi:hypothetical protein